MTQPTEPTSPTRVLCKVAAMAAGGLPAPETIYLYADRNSLDIGLTTIARARDWTAAFEITDVSEFPSDRNPVILYTGFRKDWHGWIVNIRGADPIGPSATRLDADDPDLVAVLAEANDSCTCGSPDCEAIPEVTA